MDTSPTPDLRNRSTRFPSTLGAGSVTELAAFHAFLNQPLPPQGSAAPPPPPTGGWAKAPERHQADEGEEIRHVLMVLAEGSRTAEELHAALTQNGRFPARAVGKLVKGGEVVYRPAAPRGQGLYSLTDVGWDRVFECPPKPSPARQETSSNPSNVTQPVLRSQEINAHAESVVPHVYQAWAADICLQDQLTKLGEDAIHREASEQHRIQSEIARRDLARRDRWKRLSAVPE